MTTIHPELAVARLAAREIRNGLIALVATAVIMIVAVIASFSTTNLATSGGFGTLLENPAVRALYGMPFDVTNAGGFTVWRVGTFLCVFAGLWALMATTRVLRGEEEAGRWDLLLTAPVTRGGVLLSHVKVLGGGSVAVGLAVFGSFVSGGEPADSAGLYALGVTFLTLTFVAVGAVASQLFASRRRAAGAAGAVLGISYVIRMVADGTTDGGWLRWASPLGWVENLEAFASDNVVALVPLVITPPILFAVAIVLDRRRDTDEGIIRDTGTATARLRLLRSPLGFAWRERVGGLLGWGLGLLAFGFILGAITKAFVDFIADDPDISDLMEQFGFTSVSTPIGFVSSMDAACVAVVCVYAVTGIARLWEDEQFDRLDLVFAARVTRPAWLGAGTISTAVVSALLMAAIGVGTWLGVAVTGVDITFVESMGAVANLVPLVVLFLGLAVLVHGTVPKWTVPVAGGGAGALYVLSFLGPAMNLPDWITDLSPWRHVAVAPPDPVNWAGTIVMCLLGIVFGVIGFTAYARRDLR
ncbi:MAG TPA: ABC transporter permease subunit [Jiangellaceae bacterium]|nr:ABC transporter permease subunit [Jiangellaceae bacterium]